MHCISSHGLFWNGKKQESPHWAGQQNKIKSYVKAVMFSSSIYTFGQYKKMLILPQSLD